MSILNKPLVRCTHCEGEFYEEDLVVVNEYFDEPSYLVCPDCGEDQLDDIEEFSS